MKVIGIECFVMLTVAFAAGVPCGVLRRRSPKAARRLFMSAIFLNPLICVIWFVLAHPSRWNPERNRIVSSFLGLVCSPILFGACFVLALAGALLGAMFQMQGRKREGPSCKSCGYLLRGLTAPRCAECGSPFDPGYLKLEATDEVGVGERRPPSGEGDVGPRSRQ